MRSSAEAFRFLSCLINHRVSRARGAVAWPAACLLGLCLAAPATASAQFLRLGPFDLDARARLGLVYTTNVERERPSESTEEREDYYLETGLDLKGTAPVSHNTTLTIDTGIAIEKHFVRDDLDNSSSPFGRLRLAGVTEMGHVKVYGEVGWERRSQSSEGTVIPGGRSSKTRNPNDLFEWTVGALWQRGAFDAKVEYGEKRERYQKEEFQDGDNNEQNLDFGAGWQIRDNLKLSYLQERTRTDQIGQEDPPEPKWKTTETIALDWTLTFIERPKLTYRLGLEKEDTDEEEGTWEPTHEFEISDEIQINPRLLLSGRATYRIEDKKEEDDVTLRYSVTLAHEINHLTKQSLRFEREPADTFGSNVDSDSTTWTYTFTRDDLFIYNLRLRLGVDYKIDEPPVGETEKLWRYEVTLDHVQQVTPRLGRVLRYTYFREDSNLEDEILDEHKVEWFYMLQL